jgi:hypothetical protein
MRDEYEAALDGAARLRNQYHREIVKLHRSGLSLREIADALGISHQRVHQIVSPPEEESKGPPRKATRTVVASAVVACLLAGGAVLFMSNWRPEPPIASPIAPSAAPSREAKEEAKEEACRRFRELFWNQPAVLNNVGCDVSRESAVLSDLNGDERNALADYLKELFPTHTSQ